MKWGWAGTRTGPANTPSDPGLRTCDPVREFSAGIDRQASAMNSFSSLGLFLPKVHKTVSIVVSFHRGATRS